MSTNNNCKQIYKTSLHYIAKLILYLLLIRTIIAVMEGETDQNKLPSKQDQEVTNSATNRSSHTDSSNDEDSGNIITLHRAGKEKKISWDQLKHPHARTVSKQFQHNLKRFDSSPLNRDLHNNNNNNNEADNSGGLLQIGGHLPNSTNFNR